MAPPVDGHSSASHNVDSFRVETRNLLQDFQNRHPQEHYDRAQVIIQQLESEIRALRYSCNVVAAVERFPLEVLLHIFNFWRLSSLDNGDAQWLALTHVCRRWRDAALDCAQLWSTVDFTQHSKIVEAALQRSKQVPLSFEFDPRYKPVEEESFLVFRRALSHHSQHIKSIAVFFGRSTSFCSMLALKKLPPTAPILEEIHVEGVYGFHDLPKKFLQRGVTALRRLTVAGCRIPWTGLPSAPRLTFLKLGNDGRSRPLMKTFLRSLCALPALTHLELADFLPRDAHTISNPSSLPRLRALILADEANNVVHLFRSCQALVAGEVQLTINGHHRAEVMTQNIARCLELLSQTWKRPGTGADQTASGVQTLKLIDFDPVLCDPCIECGFGDGSCESRLTLGFRRSHIVADPLGALSKALDLTPLRSLTIDNCEHIPKSVWLSIISPLAKLTEITFIQSSITTFLAFLADPRNQAPISSRFPSLRVIESKGLRPARDSDTNASLSLAMLVGYFFAHEAIPSIRELRISDGNIPEHTYDTLTDMWNKPRLPRVLLDEVHVITATDVFRVRSLDTEATVAGV